VSARTKQGKLNELKEEKCQLLDVHAKLPLGDFDTVLRKRKRIEDRLEQLDKDIEYYEAEVARFQKQTK
jgi:hypothetical protein